jgi:hypothetical protein
LLGGNPWARGESQEQSRGYDPFHHDGPASGNEMPPVLKSAS